VTVSWDDGFESTVANANVLGPGSNPNQPREVIYEDRDDWSFARAVRATMSTVNHSPTASDRLLENTNGEPVPEWVIDGPTQGPSMRSLTGPCVFPGFVNVTDPVEMVELIVYGNV
jgi:hypothetical protein